jgi:hypothetical protein
MDLLRQLTCGRYDDGPDLQASMGGVVGGVCVWGGGWRRQGCGCSYCSLDLNSIATRR